MKKFLRLLLALALCACFAGPALADSPWEESGGDMAGVPGASELPVTPITVSEVPAGDTVPDIPGGSADMFTAVPEFPTGSANIPVDVSDIPGGTAQILGTTAADDTSGVTEPPGSPTVTAPGSDETVIPGLSELPMTPESPALPDSVTPDTAGTLSPAATISPTGFFDVPIGYYCEPAIQWSVAIGITKGVDDSYFAPEQTCSVAEILTFLWRAKGSPEPINYNNLSWLDDPSLYYYKPLLWAYSNGLIQGTSAEPGSACTRAMAVTYLWKLDGAGQIGTSGFADVPLNADYAQAVAWATLHNITAGTSVTQFSPNKTCTRGQIVTFLYRAYALQ